MAHAFVLRKSSLNEEQFNKFLSHRLGPGAFGPYSGTNSNDGSYSNGGAGGGGAHGASFTNWSATSNPPALSLPPAMACSSIASPLSHLFPCVRRVSVRA